MGGEKSAPSSMTKEKPSEKEHNYIDYFKYTRSTGLLHSLSKRRSTEQQGQTDRLGGQANNHTV